MMSKKTEIKEERAIIDLPIASQSAIAVLPSKITSTEKYDSAFLDVADPVITKLSPVRQIVVRPTTASRMFDTPYDPASVGFAMGVDYVVESCIRHNSERIHAAAQLVRVLDGESLWREEYEVDFREIAVVENSISEHVVRTLNLQTSDEWKQLAKGFIDNPEAYQKFKLGRAFFTEGRFDKAIKYFTRTIEIDESYAPAYAGLTDCYLWMGIYNADSPQKTFSEAKKWANLALAKDDNLADAHTSLAYTNMFDWNWSDAESEFNLAIQLNHNCATAHQGKAHLLTALRRFAEASEEIERALEIDPFSPIINLVKGFVLYHSGQYDESLEQFHYTVSLNRRSHAAYYGLALAYMQKRMFKESLDTIHKAIRYSHNNSQKRALKALLFAMLGEIDKAQEELNKLLEELKHSYVSPSHIASIYAALDDRERAFEWLEKTFDIKDQWLVLMRDDPRFINLRGDTRYDYLIQRLDFPPAIKTS